MGVSFFEIMRGELVDRWGRSHPADFEIKAEASSLGHFASSGQVRITGIVNADPWAHRAPLQGQMHISLLWKREIRYQFSFRDEDECTYELRGRKDLRWFAPVESITQMDAELLRQGESVAQGKLSFDLNRALAFAASWWPSSSIRQIPSRPHSTLSPTVSMSASERATFEAFVRATICPGTHVPAADERTASATAEMLATMSESMIQGYRLALRWLNTMALLEYRTSFAQLDNDRAQALLDKLGRSNSATSGLRSLRADVAIQILSAPVKTVHFGRHDYLRGIGHPQALEVASETPPRYLQRVFDAESLEAETTVHAEVVVVGTGAGGAAVAAALAEQGVAVALVEEGRYRHRQDFAGSPQSRVNSLWRDAGMLFSLGTPVLLPLGKVVGGTTTINSGTCFRTPDPVLAQWRSELGFPSDFSPENYAKYSDKVEHVLQVEPGTPDALGSIAKFIGKGADAMGIKHGPLPRNAPGCTGAGECIIGCPEGAKRSTDVSFIPSALKSGAELYTGLPVTRILKRGRRMIAVEARGVDKFGSPKVLRIFAEKVVLSCGTLHTPGLLADNGIVLPRLGRNLSVHPALGMTARCPEPLNPWKAIPQGYGIDALSEHEVRFEGYYLPPQLAVNTLQWLSPAEVTSWMDDFARMGQFGFMVRDGGDGWVRRGAAGRPIIGYRLSERSRKRIHMGAALLAELYFAAGASEVYTGIARQPIVRNRGQAKALADMQTTGMDFRLLGAHPLGTCAMGATRDTAVVDFENRVFGTDNLYVVDGSSVPTSLGVNPQMTIMAMALRAAEAIGAGL